MKTETIKLKGSYAEIVAGYLALWAIPYGLAPKERSFLTWLITKDKELELEGVPEHLRGKLLLDKDSRKVMKSDLGVSNTAVNTYINVFRKRMILGKDDRPRRNFFPPEEKLIIKIEQE